MSYQEKGKVSPFVMFDTIMKSLLDFDEDFEHVNNADCRYYYLHKRNCHRCSNENNNNNQHQYHYNEDYSTARRDSLGSNHSGQSVCIGARNLRRPSGCFGRRCPTVGRLYDQKYHHWQSRPNNGIYHQSNQQTTSSNCNSWISSKHHTSKVTMYQPTANGKQQQVSAKRDKCNNDL